MINVSGKLMSLSEPRVMGILNLTPDSFYAESRRQTAEEVEAQVRRMLDEGADIIDVGACSTRPGSEPATESEEMARLEAGLKVVRRVAPDAVLSVDTFRSSVARRCVEEFGVDIVNDISGGEADTEMFPTVVQLGVPYILTHSEKLSPDADVMTEVLQFFARKSQQLHEMGLNDIILDPGFGFGKTLEQNYVLMNRLEDFHVLGLPLLVGISRKSMIYRLLGTSPQEALNGTTTLNTVALMKRAAILRVHDVREAVETIKITRQLCSNLA